MNDTVNSPLAIANATKPNNCEFLPPTQGKILIAVNAFLVVFGTFGNVLTIAAILGTPQLRQKISSFLLLSLAVADLIVCAVAIPIFSVMLFLTSILHRCNTKDLELVFVAVVFAGWSSIFHLVAISIDRVIATIRPYKHQDIMRGWWKKMLFACWGIALLSASLAIPFPKMQIALLIQFLLSVIIIICSYGVIIYKIKFPNIVRNPERARKTEAQIAIEKQVARTVVILVFLFVVCWFPVHIIMLHDISMPAIHVKYWWSRTLYLSNSSMNFIVYTLQIRLFRATCTRMMNRNLQGMVSRLRKCFCSPTS